MIITTVAAPGMTYVVVSATRSVGASPFQIETTDVVLFGRNSIMGEGTALPVAAGAEMQSRE